MADDSGKFPSGWFISQWLLSLGRLHEPALPTTFRAGKEGGAAAAGECELSGAWHSVRSGEVPPGLGNVICVAIC